MIELKGNQIVLEGRFSSLIEEAARILHAIAGTVSEEGRNSDGKWANHNEDRLYDTTIELILEALKAIVNIDGKTGSTTSGTRTIPKDMMDDFMRDLIVERSRDPKSKTFVDFDSNKAKQTDIDGMMGKLIASTFNKDGAKEETSKDETKKKKKKKKN